jgi:hypothetical protein
MIGKGGRRVKMVQTCVDMFVNAKNDTIETTSGIRGRRDKGEG